MLGFELRKATISEILQDEAGKDSLQDRFHAGYLAAVKDILNISVEDLE